MKTIALAFAAIGAVLAILAQYAVNNEWPGFRIYHTLGFIGYILIISAAACFSLLLIHQLSKEEKNRIRRYYHEKPSMINSSLRRKMLTRGSIRQLKKTNING